MAAQSLAFSLVLPVPTPLVLVIQNSINQRQAEHAKADNGGGGLINGIDAAPSNKGKACAGADNSPMGKMRK